MIQPESETRINGIVQKPGSKFRDAPISLFSIRGAIVDQTSILSTDITNSKHLLRDIFRNEV
jgi:hypothetical protein